MRRAWAPLFAARTGSGCAGAGVQLPVVTAGSSSYTCLCRCVVVSTAGGLTKRPRRHRGGLWGNHRRCAAPPTITTQCGFILAAWAVHGGQHWQHDPIGGLVGWGHGYFCNPQLKVHLPSPPPPTVACCTLPFLLLLPLPLPHRIIHPPTQVHCRATSGGAADVRSCPGDGAPVELGPRGHK